MEHKHGWVPVPNECATYSCSCGVHARREFDGSMTERPSLRLVKRIDDECIRCHRLIRRDWMTLICRACARTGGNAECTTWEETSHDC